MVLFSKRSFKKFLEIKKKDFYWKRVYSEMYKILLKIWIEWCYIGQSGHPNFSSEWCYSGQNVGVIKPQNVGVIFTPPVNKL